MLSLERQFTVTSLINCSESQYLNCGENGRSSFDLKLDAIQEEFLGVSLADLLDCLGDHLNQQL